MGVAIVIVIHITSMPTTFMRFCLVSQATVFLRALTDYWDGKLIAVIVSGYDGDGAAAL